MSQNTKNIASLARKICDTFSGETPSIPVQVTESDRLQQKIIINQEFDAVQLWIPTWAATDCSMLLQIYKCEEASDNSRLNQPCFSHRIENISDCELRRIPLDRPCDAGTYIFMLSEGGNGKGGHPGIWYHCSNVCDGLLTMNGAEIDGELKMRVEFTCTPTVPFANSDNSITIQPKKSEKAKAKKHYDAFLSDMKKFPTEITIGGIKHIGFDESFTLLSESQASEDQKEIRKFTFQHTSGLLYHLTTVLYPEYAAYEWSAELENPTNHPSPIISDWLVCSSVHQIPNAVLRGINGDGGFHNDPYSPYFVQLTDAVLSYTSPSGRSTYNRFPYFNISGSSNGLIFVLGWPGKWKATFSEHSGYVRVKGSQETLSASLPAGEKFISPVALFMEYSGADEHRITNLWRHFFIECNMKKEGDHLFEPHLAGNTSWNYEEMKDATDDNQIDAIRQYLTHGVPIDYWWMDAGWYYKTEEQSLDVWLPVGTWVVDRKRFPSGMKAISEYAHEHNVKTILWFEPEITRLRDEELGSTSIKKEWIVPGSLTRLVDIGNPDFRKYMLEHVFRIMDEGKIDLYRQDYGIAYPTNEMHAADPASQSGYIENRTYQGYYSYLDQIAARYPSMMLDSCAAGGGRNDLTTMRRAVPLHKTDADYSNYTMKTAMHQALFAWFPYFGTADSGPDSNTRTPDLYVNRCNYSPFLTLHADVAHPDEVDWDMFRKCYEEWNQIKDYYYADYYPLLPWNGGTDAWRGWEFFDPKTGCGFFQLFRDCDSTDESKQIRLHGLQDQQSYCLLDFDGGDEIVATGAQLKHVGIRVALEQRSSMLKMIRQVQNNDVKEQ